MDNWHQSQRGFFAGKLLELMREDPKIIVLTGDLGFGMLDTIKKEFPKRFINCGASEQAMIGIAVGLAQEGMKPFVYTITSFFLRCAETLHLYVGHEKAPVRLVGGGRDNDYKHDGVSHLGQKAQEFIHTLKIVEGYPETKEQVPDIIKYMAENDVPSFISLTR